MNWLQKETDKRQKQDQDYVTECRLKWDQAYQSMQRVHNVLLGLQLFGLPQRAVKWLETAYDDGRFLITHSHSGTQVTFRVDLNRHVIFNATYDSSSDHCSATFQHFTQDQAKDCTGNVCIDSQETEDLRMEPDDVRSGLKRFLQESGINGSGKLAKQICTDLPTDLEQSHRWHAMTLLLDEECLFVALGARVLWYFVKLWKDHRALQTWIESFNPLNKPS